MWIQILPHHKYLRICCGPLLLNRALKRKILTSVPCYPHMVTLCVYYYVGSTNVCLQTSFVREFCDLPCSVVLHRCRVPGTKLTRLFVFIAANVRAGNILLRHDRGNTRRVRVRIGVYVKVLNGSKPALSNRRYR